MLAYFNTLASEDAELLAWQFLLLANDLRKQRYLNACYLSLDAKNRPTVVRRKDDTPTCLWHEGDGHWCRSSQIPAVAAAMFDLYLPLLARKDAPHYVVAHLGQSIDSRIATSSGDGFFVTGEENRRHLHCLRALSDAVIIGGATVIADDPQLTTRAVAGDHAVRVVLDPRAQLDLSFGLFIDAQARTVLLHQSSAKLDQRAMKSGPVLPSGEQQVERWIVPNSDAGINPEQVVNLLASRGLRRLFVEGGGVTVSRFFEAAVLDRLHVAVAPLLVGEGTAALQLGGVEKMINAHRPPHALYSMGNDVLWDFDVSGCQDVDSGSSAVQDPTKSCLAPTVRLK